MTTTAEIICAALLDRVRNGASTQEALDLLDNEFAAEPVETRQTAAVMAADALRAEAEAHHRHADELRRFQMARQMARSGIRVVEG